jgi:ferredoxin-type protein NapH
MNAESSLPVNRPVPPPAAGARKPVTVIKGAAKPGSRGGAPVGADAVRDKGWRRAHQWLLLRRLSQLSVFALFLLGPLAGVWIVKGNLSSSLTLDVLPLTDPFVLAQVLMTRHWPETTALLGAAIVLAFYALVGGRVFCAWVCPVNVVTDSASWLRRRLGIASGRAPAKRHLRHWLLGAVLAASALTGMTVWEWVNPVSMTHRALIFGGALAWGAAAAVFVFDLLIAPRGWCGHLCPMGAAYNLIGRAAGGGLLRVSARHSSRCNDCADCFAVCPEPHVIPAPLKGKDKGQGAVLPLILSADCTNCGRCIDVCGPDVFTFTHRFDHRRD